MGKRARVRDVAPQGQGWGATDRAPVPGSARGLLEPAQKLVATGDRGIQRLLRALVTGPDRLQLFVDDRSDLIEGTKAQALGVCCRLVGRHLDHGDVRSRVRFVKALAAGQFTSRRGDWQITGILMPLGLDLRAR